jgi:hypothetical protein
MSRGIRERFSYAQYHNLSRNGVKFGQDKHKGKRMADQILKDRTGREIGRIKNIGVLLKAYDRTGRELGSYDPKRDTTYDRSGREICSGNQLVTLINQATSS